MILSYCINKPLQIWYFISVYIHLSNSIFFFSRGGAVLSYSQNFQLAPNQGIEPCRPSRRRTWVFQSLLQMIHLRYIKYFHFNFNCLFKLGLWLRSAEGGGHLWLRRKTCQTTRGQKTKTFFSEIIKKIIFNFPARCGWTWPQSWPEVHGEGGAGRQEGEQTGEMRNPQT